MVEEPGVKSIDLLLKQKRQQELGVFRADHGEGLFEKECRITNECNRLKDLLAGQDLFEYSLVRRKGLDAGFIRCLDFFKKGAALTADSLVFVDAKNQVGLFNLSTNADEVLNLKKNVGHDLRFIFEPQPTVNGPNGASGETPDATPDETPGLELSDPKTQPIFDVCYNQSESKLFVSGLNFLKTFKIFNYNY